MIKFITYLLVSIFVLLAIVITNALLYPDFGAKKICISKVELVDGHTNTIGKVDYYYVYDFNESEAC